MTCELLPRLTVRAVQDWLEKRRMPILVREQDRQLHACLVAWRGAGVILIDRTDAAREQRFSLAHEVAHFVLDHHLPRARAIALLGEDIREVLDGLRPPELHEQLSSVLRRVHIGASVHLMERGAGGAVRSWEVHRAEQRADRLAFELLAPLEEALARVRPHLENRTPDTRERIAGILSRDHGLPPRAARAYADDLLRRYGPLPVSILTHLRLE